MADLASDSSGTGLFALTLARALDLELSNTTEICLSGDASTSALTSEVRQSYFCLRGSHTQSPLLYDSSQKSNRSSMVPSDKSPS